MPGLSDSDKYELALHLDFIALLIFDPVVISIE